MFLPSSHNRKNNKKLNISNLLNIELFSLEEVLICLSDLVVKCVN